MTDTKRLSLHGRLRMEAALPGYNASLLAEAADAIERHEAFRQEVSDAVREWFDGTVPGHFQPFIIARPDLLAEAWDEAWNLLHNSADKLAVFRKAIEARGGKIVWGEG